MSHVVKLNLEVTSLKALKKAAKKMGLKFNEGVKSFNYYGSSTASCDHTLSMGGEGRAIGVVKSGKVFELKWDPGYLGPKMQAAVGGQAATLKKEYAVAAATLAAEVDGLFVTRYDLPNGGVRLEAGKV